MNSSLYAGTLKYTYKMYPLVNRNVELRIVA